MSKNIDIRRFVDIDIVHHKTSAISGTRDVAVLFVEESAKNEVISSADAAIVSSLSATEQEYVNWFFVNKGVKLHILTIAAVANNAFATQLYNLPENEIVILNALIDSDHMTVAKNVMANNITSFDFSGIKRKLFIGADSDVDFSDDSLIVWFKQNGIAECAVIAAYLTNINIYQANSVNDIDFTVVSLPEGVSDYTSTDDDDIETVLVKNTNIIAYLANENRLIGGNTSTGLDLVNEFVLIVLQQTATARLMNVLMSKVKGESGLATLTASLAQELNHYVQAGYLVTNKTWTDEDYKVTYNGVEYTIIEQGTPLLLGYHVKALPFSALSEADKAAHKAPPIYLVLATTYGIRVVDGLGEVI